METINKSQSFVITSEKQQTSQFTLLVFFKPIYVEKGNEKGSKFHSNKFENVIKGGQIIADHKYAYDKLVHFALNELTGRYITAIIYHNPTNTICLKLAYNTIREGKNLEFKPDSSGKGSVFYKIS